MENRHSNCRPSSLQVGNLRAEREQIDMLLRSTNVPVLQYEEVRGE